MDVPTCCGDVYSGYLDAGQFGVDPGRGILADAHRVGENLAWIASRSNGRRQAPGFTDQQSPEPVSSVSGHGGRQVADWPVEFEDQVPGLAEDGAACGEA
jgi:hypothetical protein